MVLVENIVDLERLALPTVSLIISFLVWVLTLASLVTPGWITLNLFRPDGINGSLIESGNITIGLIRTTERIDTEYGVQGETVFTLGKNYREATDTIPVAIILACGVVAIAVCTLAMILEFMNTYRVRSSILLGPSSMYLVTLLTSALMAASCASFAEFYIEIDTPGILNISRHDLLKFNHYTAEKELFYSPYLFFIAAIISLIPFLLSWRLTVLLPVFYKPDVLDRMDLTIPQMEPNREFVLMDVEPSGDTDDDDNDEDEYEEDEYEEESDESDEESDDVELSDEDVNEFIETYHKN